MNKLGATFTQDTSATDGSKSAKVNMSKASRSQPWNVQLRQPGKALYAGQTYTISFSARASTARPLDGVLVGSVAPHRQYSIATPMLGAGWTRYTYSLTPSITDPAGMLAFNLAAAAGQVWIDHVVLSP